MKTLLQSPFILSLLLLGTSALAKTEYFQGIARNKQGEEVYQERHTMSYQGDDLIKVVTTYHHPNGEKFASLESDFKDRPNLPNSAFVDLRKNKRELTKVEAQQYLVTTIDSDGKSKIGRIDISSDLLCGQGYHNYIRNNLNKFELNKVQTVKFVLPSRRDYYSFDLKMIKDGPAGKTFRLAITNWFLKMFADSIEVDYSNDGTLLAYRGLSNIQDDQGNNMDVLITLTKKDAPL